jgi:predicted enzyme related to lactoylglutathione lyase
MNKPINWFEIPVTDLDRATNFYQELFATELRRGIMGPFEHAVFPYEQDKATGGSLVKGEGYEPSLTGSVVYLNTEECFDDVLARVVPAGGKVLIPRVDLPNVGPIAHFEDCEGNRIGLHGAK